jgi:hypothetical protein
MLRHNAWQPETVLEGVAAYVGAIVRSVLRSGSRGRSLNGFKCEGP